MKIDKRMFKKSPEELQEYLKFKRRGSVVESKKGKGSFKRKPKYPDMAQQFSWLERRPVTAEVRGSSPVGVALSREYLYVVRVEIFLMKS